VGDQAVIAGRDRHPAADEVRERQSDFAAGQAEVPEIERRQQSADRGRQDENRSRPAHGRSDEVSLFHLKGSERLA
jgi:hypothetical protein